MEESTLVSDLGRGAGNKHNFVHQSLHHRSRYKSTCVTLSLCTPAVADVLPLVTVP